MLTGEGDLSARLQQLLRSVAVCPHGLYALGGGWNSTGSVTVPDGESRTCWITNARTGEPSAFLTVDKVCEPTTTGRFNVLVDSGEFGDNLECGQSTDAVRVGVGTHTVKEAGGTDTSLGDYTTEISCVTPTGTTTGGSVTLTDGQSATCTITNRQKPATLTVIKECVPTTDGGQFDITFTGPTPFTTPAVRCGGSTGPIAVTPGRYKVSENGALGTDLAAYTQLKGGTATPAASSTSLRANP